jgi:hypothetical protein
MGAASHRTRPSRVRTTSGSCECPFHSFEAQALNLSCECLVAAIEMMSANQIIIYPTDGLQSLCDRRTQLATDHRSWRLDALMTP